MFSPVLRAIWGFTLPVDPHGSPCVLGDPGQEISVIQVSYTSEPWPCLLCPEPLPSTNISPFLSIKEDTSRSHIVSDDFAPPQVDNLVRSHFGARQSSLAASARERPLRFINPSCTKAWSERPLRFINRSPSFWIITASIRLDLTWIWVLQPRLNSLPRRREPL